VRGQTAREAGSECSQPLPRGPVLSGFNFQGIDGRGRVELIEAPDRRNNFRAWVRIQDPKSEGEEHHFRLSWLSGGNIGGGGGYVGGGGEVADQDLGGEGLSSSSRGRGYIRLGNASDMEISEAIVDLRRNGEAVLELRGEVSFQLAGRWSRDRGDSYRLEIREGFNRSGASAEGFVYGRGPASRAPRSKWDRQAVWQPFSYLFRRRPVGNPEERSISARLKMSCSCR
jgi:hypothetical protein